MAEYQIFSDGACDIGFAKAKELGIGLIPFYISIDHETYYKEIQEISLEEYFRYMTEEKGYPKTSLPSIQDYMDAFRPALEAGKDIICITMTRTLTASLESAVTAKSMLEEEFPHAQIHVINSWVATGAQALLLMEMARMQKNGRRDNSLCTEIKSSIEILAVNEKEMTLSGNHVKGGGSYESPSLYMGHVVERCADRSTGRLLQISYVVHVVLIPAFFL